uniref:30S ribosomal protein S16 n=1 Tax=Choreocolax polysiphoniae TaxID=282351 RepID=A0A0B5VUL8_9FLOR|nr:30S ribosomal protein S16 [Choreocolax polysiphoniae]AJH65883.1 30S ribosomal protein S16 [Choreocolax polysiphoniae]
MLKIRLKRLGRKKKTFYKIILIDSRKKRDSKAIEKIGFYNPICKKYKINIIRLEQNINKGAQLTKTVQNIIKYNHK